MLPKKEIQRCKKLCRTNFRGMIKIKFLVELYNYAPKDEWKLLPPVGNEVLHGVKEGRRFPSLWWNAEKKQIECTRMGAVLWWCYCIRNDVPM